MQYHEQFYIGKIPVWIAEVDGVQLKKTDHPKKYLFPSIIENQNHAQELLDYFGLISIDLREDFRYRIFSGSGIPVGSSLCRDYEHSTFRPPTFPRELRGDNSFYYLCDCEAALERLVMHFRYMVEKIRSLPKTVWGEVANLTKPVWIDEAKMKALTSGLHEKPRRKTSLSSWMELHADD